MEIHDKKGNLLALIIRSNEMTTGKNFFTNDNSEFQVAAFNLEKDTIIKNHIHEQQSREVTNTSEVLVLIEGEMIVDIFDTDLELVSTEKLNAGDAVGLLSGGHGIKITKNCKFFEVKQGPYFETSDKKRF
tara:strand:+ start:21447 stop:21839 length:393 start_codon:yes stop_codon:yes gene_type:complete